jgi:hypothetical protein
MAWLAAAAAAALVAARRIAAERDRFEQQLLEEDRSLKESVRAEQQEARRLEQAVENEAREDWRAADPSRELDASGESAVPALEGRWVARGLRVTNSAGKAFVARQVMLRALESGRMSVSAPSRIVGSRRVYLRRYGFRGTSYNPSTVRAITGRHIVRGALSKSAWIIALGTSLIGNVIDYGSGRHRDTGIRSQEFVVSTAVDTVLAVGTGIGAALLVTGAAALFAVSLPVGAGIALTAVAGIGIGLLLDATGIAQAAKDLLNAGIDALESSAGGSGM